MSAEDEQTEQGSASFKAGEEMAKLGDNIYQPKPEDETSVLTENDIDKAQTMAIASDEAEVRLVQARKAIEESHAALRQTTASTYVEGLDDLGDAYNAKTQAERDVVASQLEGKHEYQRDLKAQNEAEETDALAA